MFIIEKFKTQNGTAKVEKNLLLLPLNSLKDNHCYYYLLLSSSFLFLFKYILFLCNWDSNCKHLQEKTREESSMAELTEEMNKWHVLYEELCNKTFSATFEAEKQAGTA